MGENTRFSPVKLSKNSPNRQSTTFFTKESFCDPKFFFRFLIVIGLKLLIILHFDFLREPHSAVPLYADECGSLGFVFDTLTGENTRFSPVISRLLGSLLC